MRQYKGLNIPVEPQESWKWMLSHKQCDMSFEVLPECPEGGCDSCIYSNSHYSKRKSFYESTFTKRFVSSLDMETQAKIVLAFVKEHTIPAQGFYVTKKELWQAFHNLSKDMKYSSMQFHTFTKLIDRAMIIKYGTAYSHDIAVGDNVIRGYVDIALRTEVSFQPLTETAFHCPDCPKEATLLTVLPDHHVAALNDSGEVLSVLELQCSEGVVRRDSKRTKELRAFVETLLKEKNTVFTITFN